MVIIHGFELLKDQNIEELKTQAQLFRHTKTGAELISLKNDDSNKVFSITFRTPPSDSTGIAHILEHAVLCGSRKYAVKEPFVELLKGSLQTFLNAFTFPDKTCYPVASQNLKDFYNLIDVYLDAVFYPRLTPSTFQQEGWHYELEDLSNPLTYRGVVFNEMKGVYSSPESLLYQYSQQSLFPDNTYGLDSGGDPQKIVDLTYEQFVNFHRLYYHPSNCRIYFYGDNDPDEQLHFINEYLKFFDPLELDSSITLQPYIDHPRQVIKTYPISNIEKVNRKAMVTVNFLLEKTTEVEVAMALNVLEHILLGMPASPLKKALIDSSLGDGYIGVGLETDLQQMYFSSGLKGVAMENTKKIEPLIMETLFTLSNKGIDPSDVAAAMNIIEFRLRENNSGNFPRGLLIMLKVLTTWLYGGDPFSMLAFEASLNQLKSKLNTNKSFFEELIERYFLKNLHRTTVILKPDSGLSQKKDKAEREGIASIQSSMTTDELQAVIDNTHKLKQMQQTPDSPAALAKIPRLKLSEIEKNNTGIPLECFDQTGARVLYHDLFTSGILYCDVGLNLHLLPPTYLPYVPLFGRSLLEMGTTRDDFIVLSQRIGQKTGGIKNSLFTSAMKNSQYGSAWLFLRGKAMISQVSDLLGILSDVLLTARLDNQKRFKQILLEEKANQEHKLIPNGHQLVSRRLLCHFNEAERADEQMNGISYLLFLRELEKKVDTEWNQIYTILEEMRHLLLSRSSMLLNVTVDDKSWLLLEPQVLQFLDLLPEKNSDFKSWSFEPLPNCEGMIVTSLVNYVGKGANLFKLGYQYNGSVHVITHFLRTSWLWEKVRLQGGAYGANCRFDPLSGGFRFVSYRDPNLLLTIKVFDQTTRFLAETKMENAELEKSIIGAIGEIDTHMLPDAKGYVSMQRYLNGNSDVIRQQMREEILSSSADDFKAFAEVLQKVKDKGLVKVLGSEKAIKQANKFSKDFLKTLNIL